jgi:hypothetical protein
MAGKRMSAADSFVMARGRAVGNLAAVKKAKPPVNPQENMILRVRNTPLPKGPGHK